MRQPLKNKPQVGDFIIYVGSGFDYLTRGESYKVVGHDEDGDVVINDDDGDREFVHFTTYGNFEVEVNDGELEDPGMIEIYDDHGVDTTGTTQVSVIVDEKGLESLRKMAEAHHRAQERNAIIAEIKILEEKLKKI